MSIHRTKIRTKVPHRTLSGQLVLQGLQTPSSAWSRHPTIEKGKIPMEDKDIDLAALAIHVIKEKGFWVELSPSVQAEIERFRNASFFDHRDSSLKDFRSLPWSSIDNAESKDLDQIEVAERLPEDQIRIRVGIAHVDKAVPAQSELDKHAQHNTTSVYTGVSTFPMLPDLLSTDKTSLREGQPREAIVVEMTISKDGEVLASSIFFALVKNQAKLVYEDVASFLDGYPAQSAALMEQELQDQLYLQDEAARRLRRRRVEDGALVLDRIEPRPIMEHGAVKSIEVQKKNRARDLIEDFMIATNSLIAKQLKQAQYPSIRRIVRTPKRWDKIVSIAKDYGKILPASPNGNALSAFLLFAKASNPERFPDLSLAIIKLLGIGEYIVEDSMLAGTGHFGLATQDYTHSTAPNRRYIDLITQRLLKACLDGKPSPYSTEELTLIAARCTEMSNQAQKVERFLRKAACASMMQTRIGEIFSAIVTGRSNKGTYIRLLSIPIEGKVVHGSEGMDVGDKVMVKLIHVSAEEGFIDFVGLRG